MQLKINLYINMSPQNKKELLRIRASFMEDYFNLIRAYFLVFRQPPQIGLELYPNGRNAGIVTKIKSVVFLDNLSFMITCDYGNGNNSSSLNLKNSFDFH